MNPELPDPFDGNLTWIRGCHEWSRRLFRSGYGQVWYQGKTWRAHRLKWTLANGPIPDGLEVLHSCDNPPCCFLGHLRLGTHLDNMRDMVNRGRHPAARRTHCRSGHEFTPENTYLWKDGARRCRVCMRAAVDKYQERIRIESLREKTGK